MPRPKQDTHTHEVIILQVSDVLRSIGVLLSVSVLLLEGLVILHLHFDVPTEELLDLTANITLAESLCLWCHHMREVLRPHPIEGS